MSDTNTTTILCAAMPRASEERAASAKLLMHRLFTPPAAALPGVNFALGYRFAEQACGDIADVFHLGNGDVRLSLIDIEGSGCEAASHAACIKYGIRAYAAQDFSPAEILRALNRLYLKDCECERNESFASVFLAQVLLTESAIRYASAAHETALIIHPDGFVERLQPTGPLVGVMETWDDDFADRTIAVQADSVLCVVSDGITEARDASGPAVRHIGRPQSRSAHRRRRLGRPDWRCFRFRARFRGQNISDDMAVLAVRLTGDM